MIPSAQRAVLAQGAARCTAGAGGAGPAACRCMPPHLWRGWQGWTAVAPWAVPMAAQQRATEAKRRPHQWPGMATPLGMRQMKLILWRISIAGHPGSCSTVNREEAGWTRSTHRRNYPIMQLVCDVQQGNVPCCARQPVGRHRPAAQVQPCGDRRTRRSAVVLMSAHSSHSQQTWNQRQHAEVAACHHQVTPRADRACAACPIVVSKAGCNWPARWSAPSGCLLCSPSATRLQWGSPEVRQYTQ